jgi:nitrous oxide reductase accessory protein NosL
LGLIAAGVALAGLLCTSAVPVAEPAAAPQEVCIVAPPQPYDPASGLALHAPRPVPVDARCPVCGMYPARNPDWAAQLVFANGDTHFFDSPLTLYQYLHDVARFSPGRSAADIAARYVTAVDTRTWVNADHASYVRGSNALGPMRAGNLPAFAQHQAAQQFAQRRGGRVLLASEITPQVVQDLGTGPVHRH